MVSVQMHRVDLATVVGDAQPDDVTLGNHEHRGVRVQLPLTLHQIPGRPSMKPGRLPTEYSNARSGRAVARPVSAGEP
jgi:hypothetical protein